jgi:hypothetical protein
MIHCACCNKLVNPRNNSQLYCSDKDCQRFRKNKWQQEKLKSDPLYYESQLDAVRLWRGKSPTYMKEYRENNPKYVTDNREKQKQRRLRYTLEPFLPPSNPGVVKMDTTPQKTASIPIMTGTYTLIPGNVVKMDAIMVQLTVLEPVTPLTPQCCKYGRGQSG